MTGVSEAFFEDTIFLGRAISSELVLNFTEREEEMERGIRKARSYYKALLQMSGTMSTLLDRCDRKTVVTFCDLWCQH